MRNSRYRCRIRNIFASQNFKRTNFQFPMNRIVEYFRWKLGLTKEAASKRALAAICLGPDDLAIDCGANVGEMTAILARDGAIVHAFEPNPHAFAALSSRFSGEPNVICHQAAVSNHDGRMWLYLHANSSQDEVFWSNGSSLLADKPNISTDRSIEVEVIDLAEFLISLGKPARVLKLDIEGAEIEVMNHLIDRNCLSRAQNIFVETHEAKIPSLVAPTRALQDRLAGLGATHVRLDWV